MPTLEELIRPAGMGNARDADAALCPSMTAVSIPNHCGGDIKHETDDDRGAAQGFGQARPLEILG
jgi:hypothetical protein